MIVCDRILSLSLRLTNFAKKINFGIIPLKDSCNIFRFTSVFPYHHRVFYCRDVHLYKPNFVPEDFNVYVSYPLLYTLAFTIPPLVILIGEVMFWLFSTKPRKIVYANCGECPVHLFTRRLFRFVIIYLAGLLIVQIFVDTIKLMTGYQRPYFLSLCNVSIT